MVARRSRLVGNTDWFIFVQDHPFAVLLYKDAARQWVKRCTPSWRLSSLPWGQPPSWVLWSAQPSTLSETWDAWVIQAHRRWPENTSCYMYLIVATLTHLMPSPMSATTLQQFTSHQAELSWAELSLGQNPLASIRVSIRTAGGGALTFLGLGALVFLTVLGLAAAFLGLAAVLGFMAFLGAAAFLAGAGAAGLASAGAAGLAAAAHDTSSRHAMLILSAKAALCCEVELLQKVPRSPQHTGGVRRDTEPGRCPSVMIRHACQSLACSCQNPVLLRILCSVRKAYCWSTHPRPWGRRAS